MKLPQRLLTGCLTWLDSRILPIGGAALKSNFCIFAADMKKVAFYTLGCKLNYSETSTIGRLFAQAGFQIVGFTEKADVYVINTCSVTDHADKKCRRSEEHT